jgi:hypothetical protein
VVALEVEKISAGLSNPLSALQGTADRLAVWALAAHGLAGGQPQGLNDAFAF